MNDAIIAVLAVGTFLVSGFNAAVGPTGGAQLAMTAALLPPHLTIPLHAAVSGSASLYRAVLLWRHVEWRFLLAFVPPSLAGTAVAARLFVDLTPGVLLIAIGGFILACNVVPFRRLAPRGGGPWLDAVLGALTGVLTVFVGATGPAVFAYIAANTSDRRALVATDAAAMAIQHLSKIVLLGVMVDALVDVAGVALLLAASGVAGTFVGVRLLHVLPERRFRQGVMLVTSLIALALIMRGLTQV